MAPFYGWGSTALRLEPLWEGSLVILSESGERLKEGWKAESTLEPPSGFKHGTLDWESSALTSIYN